LRGAGGAIMDYPTIKLCKTTKLTELYKIKTKSLILDGLSSRYIFVEFFQGFDKIKKTGGD
jgi:hypothetical protein